MRVMLMIKGDPQPGAAPSDELVGAMGSYNDELKEAGRTACSRHRRRRSVRRYDATGSSRALPLRMDHRTKSRLRILLGVIGRTAVEHG